MNDFLLDVWSDLRTKKLVPVLVIMAVALIAVPIFLLDSSSADEAAVTPPVATPQGATTPASAVSLQETASRPSSHLDIFGKNDPFRRPVKRAPARSSSGPSSPAGSATASAGGASSTASAAGAGGSDGIFASDSAIGASVANGNLPGDNGDASAGGSSGSAPGSSLPSTSKDPTSSSSPGLSSPSTSSPKVIKGYSYRVDLRFGASDQVATMKDVKRLTPLPSDRRPYVIYLGVEEDGKTAVFLVDTDKVEPSGSEGECKPSPTTCTLLYLKDTPDADQHTFLSEDGTRYGLTLTDIHMNEIGSTTTGAKAKSARSVKVTKADKPTQSERRNGFSFPDFFDLFRGRR